MIYEKIARLGKSKNILKIGELAMTIKAMLVRSQIAMKIQVEIA